MANYKILSNFILDFEGEWADDPIDQGGPTMKGVILDTYKEYCRRKEKPIPDANELKKITQAEWIDIFKIMYWDRWRADEIKNQSIANILVDWVWASGVHGITIPQKILNVTPDGKVGPITLNAIDNANQTVLFDVIKQARLKFVDDIVKRKPNQKRFIVGWKRRINAITFQQ